MQSQNNHLSSFWLHKYHLGLNIFSPVTKLLWAYQLEIQGCRLNTNGEKRRQCCYFATEMLLFLSSHGHIEQEVQTGGVHVLENKQLTLALEYKRGFIQNFEPKQNKKIIFPSCEVVRRMILFLQSKEKRSVEAIFFFLSSFFCFFSFAKHQENVWLSSGTKRNKSGQQEKPIRRQNEKGYCDWYSPVPTQHKTGAVVRSFALRHLPTWSFTAANHFGWRLWAQCDTRHDSASGAVALEKLSLMSSLILVCWKILGFQRPECVVPEILEIMYDEGKKYFEERYSHHELCLCAFSIHNHNKSSKYKSLLCSYLKT